MLPVVASRRPSLFRVLSLALINLVWFAPLFFAPATSAAAATNTYTVGVTTDDAAGNPANCPVNNAGGSGSCTLRDAIAAANADASGNSLVVDLSGLNGTITLSNNPTSLLTISASMTLMGPAGGPANLALSGGGLDEILLVSAGTVNISNLTFANGTVTSTTGYAGDFGVGGALYVSQPATVYLSNTIFSNNTTGNTGTASDGAGGGAICNIGTVIITNSTFSNNTASQTAGVGGAVYNIGTLSAAYTTFSGNLASNGSVIYNYAGSPFSAVATITDSTIANNSNGYTAAIFNAPASAPEPAATLTVTDTTFSGNTNLAGSYDQELGTDIFNDGLMTLSNNVFAEAAISATSAGCYTNTSDYPTASACPNTPGNTSTPDANGNWDQLASSLNLSSLGFHGGPTQTIIPAAGSPVLCGGLTSGLGKDPVSGTTITTDQRGFGLDACISTPGHVDAGSVQTNFLTVTTANDSDDGSCTPTVCSLRDAINAANTAGNADIDFASSLNGGTLTLTSNLPAITATGSVNITGNGAALFTIDGAGKYQPFYIPGATTVAISGLTLQNSYNSTNGGGIGYAGAILDYGTLSVTGADFLNNLAGKAGTPGEGAAILNASNASPLTITNSYFSGNSTSVSGGNGGAVLSGGPLTVSDSTFVNNSGMNGGAIYVPEGFSTTISNSTFEANTGDSASGEGGAVEVTGALTISNSTFANNTASDGTSIYNDGPSFTMTNSILDAAAACDGGTGCPTVTNASTGNVVGIGTPVVGTVDNNGGPVPTALPIPGTAAVCGGNAAGLSGYTDERGFGIDPNCAGGKMDSGAVQSDYTGIAFSAANYAAISGSNIDDPSVVVYVNEAGQPNADGVGGVPITLSYTGTGTVNGGTTATSVAGVGATFTALNITSTATTPQPISVSITAGSATFTANATLTFTQGTATTTTPANKSVNFSATQQNVTLTATVTPATIGEGYVTFTVTSGATVEGAATTSAQVAGGNASVSYALPAGLAAGSYTITAQYIDAATGAYASSTGTATLTVNPALSATTAIASTTLTAGVAATPFTPVTATGGTTPYTYTIVSPSPSLPASLVINAGTGQITGTPAAASATATYTVTVTDNTGATSTATFQLTVNAPTITMTPAAGALSATAGVAYTQTFVASGGTSPYTYTESGTLPTGLTFTGATLAGTPSQAGSFPITVTAKDANGFTDPQNYTLTVSGPTIAIVPAAGALTATVQAAYTQTFTASGGTSPYTYSESGTLPAGLSFTGNVLSGTPTQSGTFSITIKAVDSTTGTGSPFSQSNTYTLTVGAATISIAPASGTLNATAETAYTQAFTASGGTSPYTYVETGTLPTGITWNAGTGTISGTATQSGSFPFTIKATDSSTGTGAPFTVTNSYTLTVAAPVITMTPPAGALTATVAAAYTQAFSASGGVGPYTYAETGTLPGGVTLTGNALSGTPTSGGTYPITITARDANGFTDPQNYTLTVNAATIAIAPAAGPLTATGETAYTQTFTATGGTSPYTWTEAGALPAGLTWTAGTATIAGTPTASGSFPFTITAKDSSGGSGPYSKTNSYTLTVSGPTITITPNTLPAATADAAYSQQLAASGGTGPYTWTETGTLPIGVTLSTGGLLAGTPTVAGSFAITVTAKDTNSFTGTQNLTLTVSGPTLTIAPASLPAATTYTAFTQTFTASGGTAPYTWSETGTLPTGMTWTAATATLAGTPTQSGTFPISITVTDSTTGTGSPFSKTAGYTLAVSAPTITISPTTLPAATIAVAYSQSVAASGGTAPYTYTITAGALPAGLTLSGAGAITGTATAGGSFSFTVTAKDSGSFTGTQNYTLSVNAPTITLTPPAGALTATTQAAYSQTFTASGGTAPYTYTESGALPAGLTFTNGVLSGTATASGTFPITVTAKDSSTGTGPYSSAAIAYTLTVSSSNVTITWANPSAITYGTTLAGVLDATATSGGNTVAGSFAYTAQATGGSANPVLASTVLAAGTYTLTATFTPSNTSTYSTPAPKTVMLTVNQAQPTISWTPAASIAYGTNLSALLNATASFGGNAVQGSFAYTATPTGGSATAVTGSTVLANGHYTLTATFTATDATDYKGATATAPLTVTGQTLTVTANNASRVYGAANPTFTGSITGQVNGDTFTESFTTTATATSAVGTYSIVPSASGANLSDYTVVIDDGTLTITQAGTTTTLSANSSTVNPGATVTLTATVASATTGTPTGTVSFYDGSTLLGTGTLSGGTASYSTTSLTSGSHTITAVYGGDTNFQGSSTSSSIGITVGALDFAITAAPPSQTGNAGTTFTYALNLSPSYGAYPGAVTFTATGAPSDATVTFSPTTVAANAGAQTVNMSITSTSSDAALQPLDTGRKLAPVAFALLLLPLAGTKRMRRNGRRIGRFICLLLLALGGITAVTALSGCGSSGNSSTSGKSYTVTVTATSGTVTHTTTVNMIVDSISH